MITEGAATADNFKTVMPGILRGIRRASDAGVRLIQVREKNLPARCVQTLAARAVDICRATSSRVLVNERFDIAIASGAAGVQLTSRSVPLARVRKVCPTGFVIGVSTHSLREVIEARDQGADFALFGPVFDTPSKRKFGAPKGIRSLAKTAAGVEGFPVIAVGGINRSNIADILECGASGYAAIRMFWHDTEPG